jgi:hypothetical protein
MRLGGGRAREGEAGVDLEGGAERRGAGRGNLLLHLTGLALRHAMFLGLGLPLALSDSGRTDDAAILLSDLLDALRVGGRVGLGLSLGSLRSSGSGLELVAGVVEVVLGQCLSGLLVVDILLRLAEEVPALAGKLTDVLLAVLHHRRNGATLDELRAIDHEGVRGSANVVLRGRKGNLGEGRGRRGGGKGHRGWDEGRYGLGLAQVLGQWDRAVVRYVHDVRLLVQFGVRRGEAKGVGS